MVHKNIDNMTGLETLRLENNLIEEIPGEIFKCTNLIELNMDNNFIDVRAFACLCGCVCVSVCLCPHLHARVRGQACSRVGVAPCKARCFWRVTNARACAQKR